jgi:hypothetical protein
MTKTSPSPQPTHNSTAAQLAVIEHTYPRWDIRPRPGGMWLARRVTPPTPAQMEAGAHQYIIQPNLQALAAVLCRQLLIDQTARAA